MEGFLEKGASQLSLPTGRTQCDPRIPGSRQKACRNLLLSSSRRTAQGFAAPPHPGAHVDSPQQILWRFPGAVGKLTQAPWWGPGRFAFFEVYDLRGVGFESLILSLQIRSLSRRPAGLAASQGDGGAILGSEGCNSLRSRESLAGREREERLLASLTESQFTHPPKGRELRASAEGGWVRPRVSPGGASPSASCSAPYGEQNGPAEESSSPSVSGVGGENLLEKNIVSLMHPGDCHVSDFAI